MSSDPRSVMVRLLALNAAHERETAPLDAESLARLLAGAFHVGLVGEGRDGFLIALDQDCRSESPNFLWFKARFARFVYVDRIIVAGAKQGRGLGSRLYAELLVAARLAAQDLIGCEVNLDPPNPGSLAFHRKLGFREEGRGLLPSGKAVCYLARRCD